jgi:hypothetical protein
MKKILLLIVAVTALGLPGCVIWHGHDRADDQAHRRPPAQDEHASGVDHGEHPGDMDHGENP